MIPKNGLAFLADEPCVKLWSNEPMPFSQGGAVQRVHVPRQDGHASQLPCFQPQYEPWQGARQIGRLDRKRPQRSRS